MGRSLLLISWMMFVLNVYTEPNGRHLRFPLNAECDLFTHTTMIYCDWGAVGPAECV